MAIYTATPANFATQLAAAVADAKAGNTTTLELGAGTYRADLTFSDVTQAPLTIVGDDAGGDVVLTGSDLHQDWTDEGGGEWSIDWPNNWGVAATPSGWESVAGQLSDLLKRREAVWQGNTHFYHVATRPELVNNTFFVDEAGDKLYVKLSGNPNTAGLEVAYRTDVVQIDGSDNITLQNFIVEHNSDGIGHSGGCWLRGGLGNLVEDLTFRYSGWSAFSFQNNTNLIMRRTNFNFPGGKGLDMNSEKDALFEDCMFMDGNHRGDFHGWNIWSVAGGKFLLVHGHDVIRCTFGRNAMRALWYDTDCDDILIDGCKFHDSTSTAGEGLHLEVVQGPTVVQNCEFWNLETYIMHTANIGSLTYQDNKHYRGDSNTWFASGDAGGRTYTDWETSVPNTLDTIEGTFIMRRNIWMQPAVVDKNNMHWINSAQAMAAIAGGTVNNEQYYREGDAESVAMFEYSGNKNLAAYVAETGETAESYAAPGWLDPANGDFRTELPSGGGGNAGGNSVPIGRGGRLRGRAIG